MRRLSSRRSHALGGIRCTPGVVCESKRTVAPGKEYERSVGVWALTCRIGKIKLCSHNLTSQQAAAVLTRFQQVSITSLGRGAPREIRHASVVKIKTSLWTPFTVSWDMNKIPLGSYMCIHTSTIIIEQIDNLRSSVGTQNAELNKSTRCTRPSKVNFREFETLL